MNCLLEDAGMPTKKREFHFGDWLRKQIAGKGIPINKFAIRVEVAEPTVHYWLKQAKSRLRGSNLGKVARELGYTLQEFERAMTRAEVRSIVEGDPATAAKWREHHAIAKGLKTGSVSEMIEAGLPIGEDGDDGTENVERHDGKTFPEIPMFDLSVAAGPWTDVLDVPEVWGDDTIQQGLFRVRIAGDSMLPRFKTGMIIEFQCLRDGRHFLAIGADYYVQKADGSATFKRLVAIGDDILTFRALNEKKYPKRIVVARSDITRMAIALAEYKPLS
jgi:Peptidase S24-like